MHPVTSDAPLLPRSGGKIRTSVWSVPWALIPFVSLGLLTPITIGYAAIRMRSAAVAVTALLYTAGIVTVMVGTDAYGDHPPAALDALMTLSVLAAWFAGTAEAFVLRRRVFPPPPVAPGPLDGSHAGPATAEQEALRRRALRARSRQISKDDPVLAGELRIGRPDLARTHDDGGLVDVNHAPAAALTTIPGITPEIAQQIVRLRGQGRGFISAEDLATAVDLDPTIVPTTAEHTVYLD